jgi:hypothetical protein
MSTRGWVTKDSRDFPSLIMLLRNAAAQPLRDKTCQRANLWLSFREDTRKPVTSGSFGPRTGYKDLSGRLLLVTQDQLKRIALDAILVRTQ